MLHRALFVAVALSTSLAGLACKDNTVNQTSNETNNFTTVGAEGGKVVGPNGVTIEIPPGALRQPVAIGIEVVADPGAPPPNMMLVGQAYSFMPAGLDLLVDATISLPAPSGYLDVHTQVVAGGYVGEWVEVSGVDGTAEKDGFVRFKVSQLQRFAGFLRVAGPDLGRQEIATSVSGNDLVASSGHAFWSNYVDDTTSIYSHALDVGKESVKIHSEKYSRNEIVAVDADWVFFRREFVTLGRVKRDGSSPEPMWITAASGLASGPMIAARGYLYSGTKRVEIATGAITDHTFAGSIVGPSLYLGNERCVPSPDGNRARCPWGEIDFVAGTSQMRATTVRPLAATGTHWVVTSSPMRPYKVQLEAFGTDTPIETGLQIDDLGAVGSAYLAATSKHLYMSRCSEMFWIDLASPMVKHTVGSRVDSFCMQWMHLDETYAYIKNGNSSVFRVPLDKLRSSM